MKPLRTPEQMHEAMRAQQGAPKKPCSWCQKMRELLGLPAAVYRTAQPTDEEAHRMGMIEQSFLCGQCGRRYQGYVQSMYGLCPSCESAPTAAQKPLGGA